MPPQRAELAVDTSAAVSCEKRWLPCRPSGTPPAPRCSHTATPLSAQKFLVVGGGSCTAGEWTHFGDVHEFDARAHSWRELVPTEGELPPRRGHCAGVHLRQQALLVFGGTSGGTGMRELLNDFHRFDLQRRAWLKLPTTGSTPRPRRGGMSALSEQRGQLWVFGGSDASPPPPPRASAYSCRPSDSRPPLMSSTATCLSIPGWMATCTATIWTLRPGTKRTATVRQSPTVPQPVPNILPLKAPRWAAGTPPLLALASCELLERDSSVHMIVFGGSCHDPAHPRRDLSNELWLCDLVSGRGGVTWSKMATQGVAPTPRFCCGSAAVNDW